MIPKLAQPFAIVGHPIVSDVSPHLAATRHGEKLLMDPLTITADKTRRIPLPGIVVILALAGGIAGFRKERRVDHSR